LQRETFLADLNNHNFLTIDSKAQTQNLVNLGQLPDTQIVQPDHHRTITTADGRGSKMTIIENRVIRNEGNLAPSKNENPYYVSDTRQYVTPDGDVTAYGYNDKPTTKYRSDGTQVTNDDKGRVTGITYNDGTKRVFQYSGDSNQPDKIWERDNKVWRNENGVYKEYDPYATDGMGSARTK
jgi:hypothetical protein